MRVVPGSVGLKLIAFVAALSQASCALLFQESLPPSFSPRKTDAHCSTNVGWAIVDTVFAAGDVATIIGAANIDTDTGDEERDRQARTRQTALLVTGAAVGLVHGISVASGFKWAAECQDARDARAAYLTGRQAEADRDAKRRQALEPRLVREDAGELAAGEENVDAASGNGFFCSSVSCSRDAETCERERTPVSHPCSSAPSAFCFGEGRYTLCRSSLEACEKQLSASGFADRTSCQEKR